MGKRFQLECRWKQRETMRNSGGMREITAIAHTCVADWMFCGWQAIYDSFNPNTKESRYSILYTHVGGRAEPARRADDSDGSFFLECQRRRSRLPPPGWDPWLFENINNNKIVSFQERWCWDSNQGLPRRQANAFLLSPTVCQCCKNRLITKAHDSTQ